MSHLTPNETTPLLRKGDYHAPTPTDIRGPCPVVNTLANHGYINRTGRNIRASDLQSAMSVLGVSITLRHLLTSAAYLEHHNEPPTGFWAFILHPFAYLLHQFALRAPGQVDMVGIATLNLDELDRHDAVEHDVSMSRRDFAQGDNHSKQVDLIVSMLASAYNGQDMTISDWAKFRVQRIEEQKRDNPALEFGAWQNKMGLAETAFLQRIFGDGARGWTVPASYMKALFEEERLPIREGWRRRWWWPVGIIELTIQARVFGKVVEKIKSKGL